MKLRKINKKQDYHLMILRIIKHQLKLYLKLLELLMQLQTYYASLKLQKKIRLNK